MSADTPRAILFDLDDTILDDSSTSDSGWRATCGEAAGRTPGLDADRLVAAINAARDWFRADPERHRILRADLRAARIWMVTESLRKVGHPDEHLAAEIANRYSDLREEAVAPILGAIDVLEQFRSRGARLALLTNGAGPAQRQKIDRFDLARHFDYICIEGEFGCGKPDERVYAAAIRALDVAPAATWMVGDNLEWDVAAPMRMGIGGVWVDREGTGLPEGTEVSPLRVIRSVTELV